MKQNISTKRIRTYGGDIVVDAEQGTATIRGTVNSRGGDISISALGRVRTKNIISRSGDVFVVSDSGAVRTGYIRTDRGKRSGDVYHLQMKEQPKTHELCSVMLFLCITSICQEVYLFNKSVYTKYFNQYE
jgi:hypothetical protein